MRDILNDILKATTRGRDEREEWLADLAEIRKLAQEALNELPEDEAVEAAATELATLRKPDDQHIIDALIASDQGHLLAPGAMTANLSNFMAYHEALARVALGESV